ncbi:ABC transporter ATP-binding protein [Halorhabdus amylolytica]|uniref:ABC transporter ATP-binding protein n=1 Tax=Halorhabdus amylolytica TaxID=2559573 RepID=UPI0010AB4ABD|nr:sn-glycerol-3-phosphate ABC transporter ATP-binding protein UgpC [Halorhabdus amylolytica]
MARVSVDDVTKIYSDNDEGRILAVDNVSLDVKDGEFVTIVGPSGSGKSTLLRMIAGLEDITEGTIKIGDTVINDIQPQDRGVAMVFQNYALYPHMTARKNMSYGLKLTTDLSDEEVNARVEEAAEMMGIEDQLDKKPGNLSGGQQQRVATGRAIVRDPEVFLFDEPLSNLDAKLRLHMRTELQRIQEEVGTTSIYVTHDQEEAMTMSDRIVILDAGQIQQVGEPDDIYNEPANKFVANFIGSPSMNMFPVELSGNSLVSEAFEYHLSDRILEEINEYAEEGESLTLGIRPENIQLVDSAGENTIDAYIDVREPVGSDNFLYVTLGGDMECRVRVPGDVKPDEGTNVHIQFDETNLHIFRDQTGRNILTSVEPTDQATTTGDSSVAMAED